MREFGSEKGEGVCNPKNVADVICEWPQEPGRAHHRGGGGRGRQQRTSRRDQQQQDAQLDWELAQQQQQHLQQQQRYLFQQQQVRCFTLHALTSRGTGNPSMKFQSTISNFVPGCVGRGSPETALPEGEVRGQVRHAALRSQLLLKDEGRTRKK